MLEAPPRAKAQRDCGVHKDLDMAALVQLQGLPELRVPPPVRLLDLEEWRAWIEKSRARDKWRSAAWGESVRWVSAAALLAAVGMSSFLAPYDIAVRFVVAAGAVAVTIDAFHSRRFAVAAGFAALALLYNPVAPMFGFSGGWQRAVMVASAAPFVASRVWDNVRPACND